MKWAPFGCVAAGLCCALACGEPPEAPGAVSTLGRNDPAGRDSVAVSEARPTPMSDAMQPGPLAPEPPDAGAPPVIGEAPSPDRTFSACTISGYVSCDYIYVAMREADSDLCVQLTLDNCGGYQQQGLTVDVPLSWRLSSGSAGASRAGCIPGVYDAASVPITDAGGTITWNDSARRPSGLVIDVTIVPARSPGVGLDAGVITLSSPELVGALPDCED